MGLEPDPAWREVRDGMTPPPADHGLYMAHANAPDTFENYAVDHPSMLQCLGMLPGEDVDPGIMDRTLAAVERGWDEPSLWGWDFAVMAMTALRLGDPARAMDLLMKETLKNTYVASGHNRQESRADLPLYLPGNGSLLLAAALMAGGWDGCETTMPGFRSLPGWQAKAEGILPWY